MDSMDYKPIQFSRCFLLSSFAAFLSVGKTACSLCDSLLRALVCPNQMHKNRQNNYFLRWLDFWIDLRGDKAREVASVRCLLSTFDSIHLLSINWYVVFHMDSRSYAFFSWIGFSSTTFFKCLWSSQNIAYFLFDSKFWYIKQTVFPVSVSPLPSPEHSVQRKQGGKQFHNVIDMTYRRSHLVYICALPWRH